MMTKNIDT